MSRCETVPAPLSCHDLEDFTQNEFHTMHANMQEKAKVSQQLEQCKGRQQKALLLRQLQQACNHPALLAGSPGAGSSSGSSITSITSITSSSKLDALVQLVKGVRSSNQAAAQRAERQYALCGMRSHPSLPPHGDNWPGKVLVFSQWAGMLDLAGAALQSAGIAYRRLTGTFLARHRAVQESVKGSKALVLLVVGATNHHNTIAAHLIVDGVCSIIMRQFLSTPTICTPNHPHPVTKPGCHAAGRWSGPPRHPPGKT